MTTSKRSRPRSARSTPSTSCRPTAGCRSRSCAARACSLWDSEGKEYLDFLGGLAVTSLGHAHPAVADAIADQARTLLHVSNLYYNECSRRWRRSPRRVCTAGGGRVFFANSGAEANECAIKLARRHGQSNGGPERFHVLSAYGSFHGRTLTTLAATGQPQKQETFQPLPDGFRQVVFADLDALAAAMDERVCAVMLEAGAGRGRRAAVAAGLPRSACARLCDEREALLIVDEVQTGLGRTGRWFGLRARRRRAARHRHHGQGARQRRADRRVLGPHRGRRGVPARRPRHHVRRATARGAGGARRARRDGARSTSPARAAAAGEPLTKALLDSPASPTCAAPACSSPPSSTPGIDAGAVADECLDAGLVVNAVTPTALRLAPSLLVTDAEIDGRGRDPRRRCSATGGAA